jgi:serine protease inhibitor
VKRRFGTAILALLGSLAMAGAQTAASAADGFAQQSNAFGLDLYGRLRSAPGNLVVSPASLSLALSMTWAGARGETAAQMKKVLRLEGTPAAVGLAAGQLGRELADPRRPVLFHVANRLFGEATFHFEAPFLEQTRVAWEAPLEALSFRGAPEQARARINAWVEGETQKRIRDLVPPGGISRETRLVLVNAIYFLGDWQQPFAAETTRPAPFHPGPAKSVAVPTMHQLGTLRLARADQHRILELPYKGGAYSMLVVLPDALDGLEAAERSLSSGALSAWTRELRPARVLVALPRFTIDPAQSLSLSDTLSAMGMPLAFDRFRADFTGIANPVDPADRLSIARVFHKAFVKVDERGTEAAAASALSMQRAGSAAPAQRPEEFRADHPFLFLIRDNASGLVLFIGRVQDPGQ